MDLQGREETFTGPVRAACRAAGIGSLLHIRRAADGRLPENTATFTAAVDQICRAWLDARLPEPARTGHHALFLSGPTAIALALGARLANVQPDRWTIYNYDGASSTYEPFPRSRQL